LKNQHVIPNQTVETKRQCGKERYPRFSAILESYRLEVDLPHGVSGTVFHRAARFIREPNPRLSGEQERNFGVQERLLGVKGTLYRV
jgi:hypothetical protein